MDSVKIRHLLMATLVLLTSGCGTISNQSEVESKFAGQISLGLRLHDIGSPSSPVTNLVQLFPFLKFGYPYGIHHELSQFGSRRGFTNSVAEKYVFFLPRLTNALLPGEIICLGTTSFRTGRGQSRICLFKEGADYVQRVVSEKQAQAFLQTTTSRIIMPPAHSMPPPPSEAQDLLYPALNQRYERLVWNLTGALGQESSLLARWLLRGSAALLLALMSLTVFAKWRTRR